jgi:hypothetical protein
MDCLLIAAVLPISCRRKPGQLHTSRVQARMLPCYPDLQIHVSLAGGGRMTDDVFGSAMSGARPTAEQAEHPSPSAYALFVVAVA